MSRKSIDTPENILQKEHSALSLKKTTPLWCGLALAASLFCPDQAQAQPSPNTKHQLQKSATSQPTTKSHLSQVQKPQTPRTHEFINTLQGGYPYVQSVAFSSDARKLLVGAAGRYGGVRMWSWWAGIEYELDKREGDPVRVGFLDKDKKYGVFRVHTPGDSVNGNSFFIYPVGKSKSIHWSTWLDLAAFSPSSAQAALYQKSGKMMLYRGKNAHTALPSSLGLRSARGFALSPGLRYVAFIRDDYGPKNRTWQGTEIVLSDLKQNKPLTVSKRGKHYATERIVLTHDGTRLALGQYGKAEIWDPKQQKLLKRFLFKGSAEILPVYSPDEKTLILVTQASVGRSWSYGNTPSGFHFRQKDAGRDTNIFFYDARSHRLKKTWTLKRCFFRTTYFRFGSTRGQEHNPERVAFSPKGSLLAVGCNGGVSIFDISKNRRIKTVPWIVRKKL